MAGRERSKLKLLYILDYLKENTDESSGVTTQQIISYLSDCGISSERKAIYRDIRVLNDYGYKIVKTKKRNVEYCLVTRDFELAELKILVDAIQSASFISDSMSREIIKKIENQTSQNKALELRRQIHYSGRLKTGNNNLYKNINALHEAVDKKKIVSFKYIDYVVGKGLHERRNGELYEISPYALVWNDDKYYAVGYYERYQKICNFRIDRMKSVSVTNKSKYITPSDFVLADYIKENFNMYGGERKSMDILFEQSLANVVVDRFGEDTLMLRQDEDHFIAHVKAEVSPTFFAWLFQFGNKAKILKPKSVVDAYKARLQMIIDEM